MEQYLPIVAMIVLATGFGALSFVASRLLGPSKPTLAKSAPYECGIVPSRAPAQRFPVRFYLVAMIFIIFDIEIIFLYPWAVMYHQLNVFGLGEMLTFSVAVLVSFLYLISNGALDWGPSQRPAIAQPASGIRTSASTIRRVPRPAAVLAGTETSLGVELSGDDDAPEPSETGPEPYLVPAGTNGGE